MNQTRLPINVHAVTAKPQCKLRGMNANLQTWLSENIDSLKDQHLYKVPKILESAAGGRVRMNGKEVVNLASNNYLGLANHPKSAPSRRRSDREMGCRRGRRSLDRRHDVRP